MALVNAGASRESEALVGETPQGEARATEKLSQVARLMAERTTQSWTTAPHFFVTRDADATALGAAREKFGPAIESERGVRLSHTDLLIAAVAHALEKHPRVNASWTGSGIQLNPEINVGIAMAVDDGVVTAVIPAANRKHLGEIAVLRRDLAERARSGKLRPGDISGATFTISNLGMHQVDSFTAIIVPPQAAILAVGRISDRVVAVNGQPAVRSMMTLTLSSDHRVHPPPYGDCALSVPAVGRAAGDLVSSVANRSPPVARPRPAKGGRADPVYRRRDPQRCAHRRLPRR